MPTTHFNVQGWETICKLFVQETKKSYTRGKLKNHWDNMKKEWQAWIFLKQKTSGLGWDPQKKTHAASKAWWNEMAQVNKRVLKFKNKGLEHEDEYEELFSRVTATGFNAWTPSQGLEHEDDEYVPQPLDPTSGYNDITIEENIREEAEDDSCEEIGSPENDSLHEDSPVADMTPVTISGKRKKNATNEGQSYGSVRKGKRFSGADKITDALDRMVSHMERRADATLSIINGSSVKESLKILNQVPGVTIGSPLYHLACRLFAKPYNRELFIQFDDNNLRLSWLKEMELREQPVYPPQQQFGQIPSRFSQLLAQPSSGFSLQFGQPSSGFSQQVAQFAQPPTGFSQFVGGLSQPVTTLPLGGFSQLLAQPTSGVIANQLSDVLSPHSTTDA